ncbi:unnamed protein product [Adineta steineri]|uniref:Uncharacterized protein n=1 Tax=Adineta steineri TaxID=433720 RepID=A0A819I862_9BILA|nr:unnamed protein product [Adineta steineri]CAF3906432.1 unnamed protein product [Adineta steineri]CAF3914660.1 unnamed protein product [Adineta steineri]
MYISRFYYSVLMGCLPLSIMIIFSLLAFYNAHKSDNRHSPFYISCCVSERFRKQLVYVLVNIWLNRWRQWINRLNNNQIGPNIEMRDNEHLNRIRKDLVEFDSIR